MNNLYASLSLWFMLLGGCIDSDKFGKYTQRDICKALIATEYPNANLGEIRADLRHGSVFLAHDRGNGRPTDHYECFASGGRIHYMFAQMDRFITSREFHYSVSEEDDSLTITIVDEYGDRHHKAYSLTDFKQANTKKR